MKLQMPIDLLRRIQPFKESMSIAPVLTICVRWPDNDAAQDQLLDDTDGEVLEVTGWNGSVSKTVLTNACDQAGYPLF